MMPNMDILGVDFPLGLDLHARSCLPADSGGLLIRNFGSARMPIREDAVVQVGPLNLAGPAIDRDRRVKENNDYQAVDLKDWMSSVQSQEQVMEASEVRFFETLRAR